MKNFYQKGITFIEILVVLAAIGILVLVVTPEFSKMRENQVLKSAVEDALSALNKARSRTLASENSLSYGVHFQADKVIIFTGIVFDANNVSNENINIVSPATISNISLTGGAVNIYFNRLTGIPNVNGTVTISTTNYSKIITISSIGVTSLN